MKRQIDMNEISDGNLYDLNDLVKVQCNDCNGCSACCRNMGQSVVLDPYDIYQLTLGLKVTFEQLLSEGVELNVIDGVILPNLKMSERTNSCMFLDEDGRCKVHAIRPGVCRMFPLGRYYEEHDFKYFIQIHECKYPNKTKVKVKKWIDTPELEKNHKFIIEWHDFVEGLQKQFLCLEEEKIKKIDLFVLQHFFIEPYSDSEEFYVQFETRLQKAKTVVEALMKS